MATVLWSLFLYILYLSILVIGLYQPPFLHRGIFLAHRLPLVLQHGRSQRYCFQPIFIQWQQRQPFC